MFDLRRPCTTCPFRIGVGETFRLPGSRLAEIRESDAFQCHKTVNYGGETQAERAGDNPQQCAGLMAVHAREGDFNNIMRMAMRFGVLDTDTLDPREEAYASWSDVERAHAGEAS